MKSIAWLALAVSARAAAQPIAAPLPHERMQPGYGVVERVTPLRLSQSTHERSAAAGGSSPRGNARPVYRIAVRMADGSLQYRDLDRPEFRPGDRVLLTNAGDVLPD